MTPSFKTWIGFLTDAILDWELTHFFAGSEKCLLSQVTKNGNLQKPIFKDYFFISKYSSASWVLWVLLFQALRDMWALCESEERIVSLMLVRKVLLSLSLAWSFTVKFVVSAAARGVWVREMDCAIRRAEAGANITN